MKTVTLTINGRRVSADAGSSILQAARANGIDIPSLCFHEALPSRGSCWLCIVEIKGHNRFIPACNTLVGEGMAIETDNDTLRMMRRQSLERIIAQHCGDCLGPCERSCPAGCDIPGFVAAVADGRDREAHEIIMRTIPLPGILGRVCPAPCEESCRRHGVDDAVSICALKRFAADRNAAGPDPFVPERKPGSGRKVAIVGSGPAGLTAAYYLLAAGHGVTIIDSREKTGGVMRYGIPRFRLPETVIENDIAPIVAMGAEFRMSTRFGTDIDWETLKKDHDALFLAVGAGSASPLGIPGDDLPGVMSGIGFLEAVATGKAAGPGDSVIVVGGGNTAIDAARTALRLGAEVTIMYRRERGEMPANAAEIDEAVEEGVILRLLAAPVAIERSGAGLSVTAVSMTPGKPDESGRRRPEPVEGSESVATADMVIAATGQSVQLSGSAASGIGFGKGGVILVDPATLETGVAGVFAGGDCVSGPGLAIHAVEQGRIAADSIDRFLNGLPLKGSEPVFNSSYGERDKAPAPFYARAKGGSRTPVPERAAGERRGSFDEAVFGYDEELARKEAMRCLQCRCNAVESCRLRELATAFGLSEAPAAGSHEEFSIDRSGTIRFEREKCVDCGICVRTLELAGDRGPAGYPELAGSCPTGAISLSGR